MANLEENAFLIARYLLDNLEEIDQVEVQKALELDDRDFAVALKFLGDAECLRTSGTVFIGEKNLARLQNFVNQIYEKRISISTDAERLLKFLFNSQTPTNDSEKTMAALAWDEKRYLNALETLKFREYIDIKYYDNKPSNIWITSKGKETVKNNFRIATSSHSIPTRTQSIITNRPIHVFLCHAFNDKPTVHELYNALKSQDWINPWLDKIKILPGQNWRVAIEEAVEESDVIIICISNHSVNKEGFVQKEIRYAYDLALEKPEGVIFLIPLRLEECEVPRGMRSFQWVDYFGIEKKEQYSNLLESLRLRHKQKLKFEEKEDNISRGHIEEPIEEKKPVVETLVAKAESKPKPVVNKPTIEISKPILSGNPTPEWIAANKITLSNGIEFMSVPAGKFLMGSDDDPFDFTPARPQHIVDIEYDYWMARFPITNELYNVYLETGESYKDWWEKGYGKKDHPVVDVNWHNAMKYCNWLNNLYKIELPTGFVLRLPTEAEWEKAARGVGGRKYPWGDEFDFDKCNIRFRQSNFFKDWFEKWTTPVTKYTPNADSPYGCADMVGNVMEWTHSLVKIYPYDAEDGRENEAATDSHILRSCSYLAADSYTTIKEYACCYKRTDAHNMSGDSIGFRVILAPKLTS